VEYPRAHLELLHGGAHQAAPRLIEPAQPPYLARPHVGVAGQGCPLEALALGLPGALHAAADDLGGLAQPVVGQFVVVDPRDLDVDIDVVKQWRYTNRHKQDLDSVPPLMTAQEAAARWVS
jgi:hypothetical protein